MVNADALRTVDLFSGCGGMSLGFQNAGFDVIAAFDNWGPAINVYRLNFKHDVFKEDLGDPAVVDKVAQLRPDVIIGGPPCQDFSTAGPMDENGKRAALSAVYCKMICQVKPLCFVMENVAQIQNTQTFIELKKKFSEEGYGLTQRVIDACYVGVPQHRKRMFLIGVLGAPDDFLGDALDNGLSNKAMTIRDYLGDSLGTEYYFRVPTNYTRRGVYSIDEPSMTVRGVDRPIPPGYKKHPNDPVAIGPEVRCLTPKERSYIQTFPKDFVFEGPKTHVNQMIGNAVPVKLAQYVATKVGSYLSEACDE